MYFCCILLENRFFFKQCEVCELAVSQKVIEQVDVQADVLFLRPKQKRGLVDKEELLIFGEIVE